MGQGKQFSPELFNISLITQPLWCNDSSGTHFADDGGDVIAADTEEECQALIQKVAERKAEWFDLAGLSLNAKKSEVIGFGFTPAPITVGGEIIHPSTSITFLGTIIDNKLNWEPHVTNLCSKIRWQAGRIRDEGHLLRVKDRKTLLHAWILSRIHNNALAFLPSLGEGQLAAIQTAVNAGIRAVMDLPRRSITSISEIRTKMGIPSVQDIRDQCLLKAAFRNRLKYRELGQSLSGPLTRSRARGEILHPVIKGQLGKMTTTWVDAAWNKLPKDIKESESEYEAFSAIKAFVKKEQSL